MKFLERLLWTAAGVGAGYVAGRILGKDEEEKKKYSKYGMAIGGGLTFGLTFLFNRDAVNYTLYHENCRVYDGITKEARLNTRVFEHKMDGKVFDKVVCDVPKLRSQALDLERYRIRRFKGEYNIHHNP